MSTEFRLDTTYKLIIFDWEGTLASCDGELFPGLREALALFRENNIDLAVATSMSTARLKGLIADNQLDNYFACLRTSEMGPAKPDPEMLTTILMMTGHEANEALMVGDSTFDMQMAIDANIFPVGVLSGSATAEQLHQIDENMLLLQDASELSSYLINNKTAECL